MSAKFSRALAVALAVSIAAFGASASVAAGKAGAKCSAVNATTNSAGAATLTCKKVGGKLIWVATKPTAAPGKTPATSPTPTPSPNSTSATGTGQNTEPDQLDQPGVTELALYTGGSGPSGANADKKSVDLPSNAPSVQAGTNVKLWVYDPENSKVSAGSNGIFVSEGTSGSWHFEPITTGGFYLGTWKTGDYSVDTVEPNGNATKYGRHRYSIHVDALGNTTVDGLLPNSSGFYTLTLDLNGAPRKPFVPATPCQLAYQAGGDTALSSGFPRGVNRLPNSGTIRALIVPVDFSDVPGAGKPSQVFFDMAKGTHDFYLKESAGKVHFDFKVLENWQRQAFSSTSYNLGSYNGGDSGGYYRALIRATDPIVDYSQFDVVYFLSPPTIPWKSIAYGPAFPTTIVTGDGPLYSGTISGADAYSNTTVKGDGWKWMSHETGHLFGLHDLYTIGTDNPFGAWDLMSLNWSNNFIELTAWNRYISGWLADSQIACVPPGSISASGTQLKLDPLETDSAGTKALAIPLSDSQILVVESRKGVGLDVADRSHRAGTLVYTVDMKVQSIKGGWHVIAPSRTQDRNQYTDAALQAGESVSVSGITVKVLSQDASGDVVTVTRG